MEYLNLNSFETKRSVTIDSLKTHFLPIQEGEGDPSPDNIRPITGWNSIKIRKCGKNLAKIVGYSAIAVSSIESTRRLTNNYGTTISTIEYSDEITVTQTEYHPEISNLRHFSNGYFNVVFDNLPLDKRYNVSFKVSNITSNPLNATLADWVIANPYGNYIGVPVVTEDGHLIFTNANYRRNTTYPSRCGWYIYNCGMSFTLSEFMVTAVEDEDFTYEPYREEEVEVELPKTMYGGYVDIAKGEIVETCKLISFGGTSAWSDGGVYTGHRFSRGVDSNASNARGNTDIIVCNYLKPAPNGQSVNVAVYGNNIITASTTMKGVYVNVDFADTVDEWKAYLAEHPLIFIYNLETPIHYPLPPETLKTLRGFNTIFSTGNNSIEVGYSELSPMSLLELRRNIIASEPHLVTVETGNTEDSDVIASFKTNTALPLKSMIVNFEPKQEGEGDPSPDNIRPITGLSELEVHNYPHLVQWNQWLQPLTEENWRAYDTSNNTVTFSEDGIATNEWVNTRGGYSSSIRNKVGTPQSEGQVWYVSYMVRHHGQDTKYFGVECCGGRQFRSVVAAEPENWYRVSVVATYSRGTRNYVYIANISDAVQVEVGLTADIKAPIHINLTQMYGAGNEPTKDEFEAQCALNGIDLTTYNPYDEGTVIPWRMSADEDRVYNIPLTLPNLITPEPKSITSYNVDFTVNEDCTVDYEGTPTSYAGVVAGFYYPKGGETITVTICGDNANLCFNAVQIYYDNKWNNPYPALEGKKTYTLDLSEFPDARMVIIALKRMSNSVYMKGKCWVRVVEGTVDTGDEVFGGYVDLDNNEFVKTWECVGLDSLNWSIFCADTNTYPNATPVFSYGGLAGDISLAIRAIQAGIKWYVSGLANPNATYGLTQTSMSAIHKENNTFTIAQSGSKGIMTIRADDYDNVADLKRFLQGKKVAYPKEVPVHFPLSPTVIRTLKGMNNIYTNANGKSIIKYWTH